MSKRRTLCTCGHREECHLSGIGSCSACREGHALLADRLKFDRTVGKCETAGKVMACSGFVLDRNGPWIYNIQADSVADALGQLVRTMKAQNDATRRIDNARFVCADGSVVTIRIANEKSHKKRPRKIGDVKTVNGKEYTCRQATSEGCYLVNNGRPVLQWVDAEGHEL